MLVCSLQHSHSVDDASWSHCSTLWNAEPTHVTGTKQTQHTLTVGNAAVGVEHFTSLYKESVNDVLQSILAIVCIVCVTCTCRREANEEFDHCILNGPMQS